MIIIPKIKCNNCGILVDSSHKFCSKCGSNIHTKTWEKYIFGTGWWARNKWATPLVIILVIIALFFINSYSDTLKKQLGIIEDGRAAVGLRGFFKENDIELK